MSAANLDQTSERREWTHLDRSGWDLSPEEPDVAQWIDPYTGFRCMVNHCDDGHLCGYVGVAPGHRLYGLEYSGEIDTPEGWAEQKSLDDSCANPIEAFCFAAGDGTKVRVALFVDVHGGLTYSDSTGGERHLERVRTHRPEMLADYTEKPHEWMCWIGDDGAPQDTWWLGFDCAHHGDRRLRRLLPDWPELGVYRDFGYVEAQVTSLAAQLKRLTEMLSEDPS